MFMIIIAENNYPLVLFDFLPSIYNIESIIIPLLIAIEISL